MVNYQFGGSQLPKEVCLYQKESTDVENEGSLFRLYPPLSALFDLLSNMMAYFPRHHCSLVTAISE